MDLTQVLLQAFWLKASEGWRKLAYNETRDSHAPHCSHYLYYEKKYPDEKPIIIPRLNVEYTIDHNGIVTMKNAKALAGTFIHEAIQGSVSYHEDFIGAEDLVTRKISDKMLNLEFLQSGHIDIDIIDETKGKRIKVPVDIKSVGLYVFPGITGQRNMPEHGYTYQKYQSSIIQANEYAVARNATHFFILWISRDSYQWKLESFLTDQEMHKRVIIKLADVNNCLKCLNNKNPDMPKFTGVCFCELGKKGDQCYCRHYKGGTTGDFPEFSGANCPGKTKLKQALEHQDLLELAKG